VNIECDRESPIAASFADYLVKLRIDVGDEYVVEAVSEIEKLTSELSAALGITLEAPDNFAHGYPTFRGRLGTEKNPQWVWISPNIVQRGFVRPDHARYAELKDLMAGLALRFPEVPPDGYILSATDAVRTNVVRACVRSGMAIRPLNEYVQDS
jgi:hypothetical protein